MKEGYDDGKITKKKDSKNKRNKSIYNKYLVHDRCMFTCINDKSKKKEQIKKSLYFSLGGKV